MKKTFIFHRTCNKSWKLSWGAYRTSNKYTMMWTWRNTFIFLGNLCLVFFGATVSPVVVQEAVTDQVVQEKKASAIRILEFTDSRACWFISWSASLWLSRPCLWTSLVAASHAKHDKLVPNVTYKDHIIYYYLTYKKLNVPNALLL